MAGELHEISEALGRIEGQLTNALAEIKEHGATLNGNGSPGVKTRLDRLEQSYKKWARLVWVMLSAAATVIGHAIYQAWRGHNG